MTRALCLAAVLLAPVAASAAPIVAIGGAYNVSSGTGLSTVTFSSGIVLNDAGAGSTLPFTTFPSAFSFNLGGLTTNPGSVPTTPSSVTLTQGAGAATFAWGGTGTFQYNSDNTASLTFTGVTMTANSIPGGNADLSLFNDSNNELRLTFLAVSLDSLSPGRITVAPGAVSGFALLSEPFPAPAVPEPATLLTLGLVGAAGGLYVRRKRAG